MNVGELLEGRFELQEVLGEGGMGQVFRAKDRELDRFVAVKTLLPQFLADPAAMDDMKREVRLAQCLHHPNIVAVYDYRVHGRTPYIVMEFVEGHPLVHHIYAQQGHLLSETAFRVLAESIMTGVEYAHQMGVVHRDLKPENIMVAPTGHLKLMDFGIAAAVQANYTRMTGRSSSMSVAYASPEQINGADPAPSMDIYSLGCVFYTMLCGHPPFYQGEIVHQQLTRQAPPVPGVSAELNNVVLACLAKDAAARPQSVTEIRTLLQGNRTIRRAPALTMAARVRAGLRRTRPPQVPLSSRPLLRRGFTRQALSGGALLAAGAGLLAAALLLWGILLPRQARPPAAATPRLVRASFVALPWARVTLTPLAHDATVPDLPPAETVTPLSVDLAEGEYRAELENGGLSPPLVQTVTIRRGEPNVFVLRMPQFDPDQVLAEVLDNP